MNLREFSPIQLPADAALTEDVFIGKFVLKHTAQATARHLGPQALVVADPDTWESYRTTNEIHLSGFPKHILPERPHADHETVQNIKEIASSRTGLIAVGSGTINDLCKMAAHELGIPYAVVDTALSMNGYTSGIAAILQDGLKTTQPAAPPTAVILDTRITKNAPTPLTQAGVGDLLSKQVSTADYWLSDQLEQSGYSPLPSQLVDEAVEQTMRQAEALNDGNESAYEALARALTLSGVSMVVAGSSAPASGGEHLISHLWDINALASGKKPQLHGAQVGVATCLCAALYQRILNLNAPVFPTPPPWDEEAQRIRRDHGRLANSVLPQAQRKHQRASLRVAFLQNNWPSIRHGLFAMNLPTPNDIQQKLQAVKAPHRLKDLKITHEQAVAALRLARDIRDRVTVLDLAFELGVFPDAINEVIAASGTG